MIRRLPPLNQLRAFEAAARHLSFKCAADELNVTHAAVSHQIKALEESLETRLFHRGSRGVTLTEEARDLAQSLTEALDLMDGAVGGYRARTGQDQITISTVPWYANRVLLPALEAFHSANPDLHIKLEFSYGLVDLENSEADAALRHGNGHWPGLVAVRVHDELLSPVCAPSLVEGLSLPIDSAKLAEMTLAVAKGYEDTWHEYFELAGWQPDKKLHFIEFENRALATEFSIAGHGVALPDIIVTGNELRSGQLTLLSNVRLRPETGAYLVFPKTSSSDERFGTISDWMHGLFAALPVPKN